MTYQSVGSFRVAALPLNDGLPVNRQRSTAIMKSPIPHPALITGKSLLFSQSIFFPHRPDFLHDCFTYIIARLHIQAQAPTGDLWRAPSITEPITILMVKACLPMILMHSLAQLILIGILNKAVCFTCIWKIFRQNYKGFSSWLFENHMPGRLYKALHFYSPTRVFPSSSFHEIKVLISGGIAQRARWVFWPILWVEPNKSPCAISSTAVAHTDPNAPHAPTTLTPPPAHVHDFMCMEGMNCNSFCCCLIVFLDSVRGVGLHRHTQLPTFSLFYFIYFLPKSVLSAAKTSLPTRKQIQLCEYVCVLI